MIACGLTKRLQQSTILSLVYAAAQGDITNSVNGSVLRDVEKEMRTDDHGVLSDKDDNRRR